MISLIGFLIEWLIEWLIEFLAASVQPEECLGKPLEEASWSEQL